MNKQLAKTGSTLNKNMTNTESLSLTGLSCKAIDLPTTIPTTFIAGSMYYNVTTQSIRIYDGLHWYQVILAQVP